MSDVKPPVPAARRYDLWVCRGRMCTANGSNAVAAAFDAAVVGEPCVTVLRGGCYGLCDLGPNVVVRRHLGDAAVVEHSAADRLTLTGADDESVYCGVDVADVVDV
ncbi:MAG TPA: (2Fe-2S) ferredoxin domain-containing protein, partial [Myxococcota bacterium]